MRRGAGRARHLLELLIVVVILGVLGAIVLPRIAWSAAEAKKNACAHNCAVINGAVQRWYFDKGEWPDKDLDDIGADPDYLPGGVPRCPVDDSKYKLDNGTHRVVTHDH